MSGTQESNWQEWGSSAAGGKVTVDSACRAIERILAALEKDQQCKVRSIDIVDSPVQVYGAVNQVWRRVEVDAVRTRNFGEGGGLYVR